MFECEESVFSPSLLKACCVRGRQRQRHRHHWRRNRVAIGNVNVDNNDRR